MCEFTCGVVNAQVGVRGANPLGRGGGDANPPGRSGLVPECAPTPDYRHRCSGQKLLCVLGRRGGGGGEYTEGTAWKWEWGTCRCSRHHTPFSHGGKGRGGPHSAPLPHTRRDLAKGLRGGGDESVS